MIVTYCTENYYRWLPLFVRSWRKTNGDEETIHVNGCNLKVDCDLVDNEHLDMTEIINSLNMSQDEFTTRMHNVAEGVRANRNRHIMNFFADDNRIKRLYKTIIQNPNEKYFLHIDIDVIFRNTFDFKMFGDRDIGVVIKDSESEGHRTPIGILYLKNTDKVRRFVKEWCNLIDSVPLKDRHINDFHKKAWGQYTFYHNFYDHQMELSVFSIPKELYLDDNWSEESVIWSANKRLSYDFIPTGSAGNKTNTYRFFENEVNK